MCTRMGCLVETRALPIMRNSRSRVRAKRRRLRTRTAAEGCADLLSPAIKSEKCPSPNYTLARYTASTPVPAYYCPWLIRYLRSKWNRNLMTSQPPTSSDRKMPLTQLYISPLHRKHACPCVLLSVANQILTLEMEQKRDDKPAPNQFRSKNAPHPIIH